MVGCTAGLGLKLPLLPPGKPLADSVALPRKRSSSVNVKAVHPAAPYTQRSPALVKAVAERDGITEDEATRRMLADNALRRVIHADDVAALVTFLASPLSVAVNGDVIAAGGGVGQSIYY